MPAADGSFGFHCQAPAGALDQFPLIAEQVFEEAIVPFGRVAGPRDLEPAGNRVVALAGAEAVLPAEPLLLDRRALRLRADMLSRIGSAMRLAEGMAAGDQRHRLLVVHRHARKGLADVARRSRADQACRSDLPD